MEKLNTHFASKLAELLTRIEPSLQQRNESKLTLIIHAGTPKTGTTSLQTYLDKKQRKLRGKGVLYPHNLDKLQNTSAPKHQWFEKNLVTTNVQSLLENFTNIIAQIKEDTHTIILSSEGIYNYWWDFPEESKDILIELRQLFDIKVWVWFREPLEFIESYYKQCIRNPQVESNPCYGKDLSFAEMLDIDWFSQHLNYQDFVTGCQTLFGENSVSAFKYEGDVVMEVSRKLGLATPHDNPTPRQNKSLNSASIQLLRTINHYDMKAKDKAQVMPHLKEINTILESYATKKALGNDSLGNDSLGNAALEEKLQADTLIDETSKKRVLALFKPAVF